ncbi:hypothetical protein GLI01_23200 [Gluconacetobacter liquefaciens]|uniref:AlpA family transcriptional regulator n=1 Tax=Gluconacetobacter liquefaciens TaxID=89584 RepID=A0A370GCU2_GLULI|nr:hypothetical protein [Gluconacetobacter liquefaciens]RDI40264.1 AlpA family transcriptional regulator [Gluconacetobacter liquefaciens]GBQ96649.1 hypothetical protein AA0522_0821 [Gluconacetobacter liquefaciens NRIC 0522]GEB38285.1 hypothetical protein GLI01_23200 [Gluconacetobacter liquefaciens]
MHRVKTRNRPTLPTAPAVPTPPLVVSEPEAARLVGLGIRTMQQLRADGAGPPFVKLTSRRIGYSMTGLQDWIASRSARSTSDATVRLIGGAA